MKKVLRGVHHDVLNKLQEVASKDFSSALVAEVAATRCRAKAIGLIIGLAEPLEKTSDQPVVPRLDLQSPASEEHLGDVDKGIGNLGDSALLPPILHDPELLAALPLPPPPLQDISMEDTQGGVGHNGAATAVEDTEGGVGHGGATTAVEDLSSSLPARQHIMGPAFSKAPPPQQSPVKNAQVSIKVEVLSPSPDAKSNYSQTSADLNAKKLREYIASFRSGNTPPCRSYRHLITLREFDPYIANLSGAQQKGELKDLKSTMSCFKKALNDLIS